ncbi:hypothetical protein D0Z07_3209 [Hyphodiscus hymeniophilus]|uniref:Uncharacterized protein n=1 Tax=Hyphodiscus hymeniophilus TaxID=353542 RepID=A0A9P6VN40_9HELO|nr:hypothetical protein D0Z07_3209 [Hyphodiscus hymeniophilus]
MELHSIDIHPYCSMNITLAVDPERRLAASCKMDISACLNRSEEHVRYLDTMETDGSISAPTARQRAGKDSEASDPTFPRSQPLYPYTLPPKETQQLSLSQDGKSSTILPSVGMLLQTIGPLPPLKVEKPYYGAHAGILELQKQASSSNWLPSQIGRSQSGEGIVRTFNDYHPRHIRVDEQSSTRRSRRRSCHSPRSAGSPYHRSLRHGSQPQLVWSVPLQHVTGDGFRYRQPKVVAQDPDTHYDTFSTPISQHIAHINRPYTPEMCDWIRYHRVDRGLSFKQQMLPLFFDQFPNRYEPNATEQTLSSRYYRDNDRPWLDENNNWDVDEKGALKTVKAKVRDATTAEGRDLDFPMSLVDKWPARLLCEKYRHWKSPILEEDRERAEQILAGNDPNDPHGKRAEWRRILCATEHLMYKPHSRRARESY